MWFASLAPFALSLVVGAPRSPLANIRLPPSPPTSSSLSSVVVEIASGPIRGTVVNNFPTRDVQVFKGIPYAAAPVDDLRWRPPQPPKAWKPDVREATEFGADCKQGVDNATAEDCLQVQDNLSFPFLSILIFGFFCVVSSTQDTLGWLTPANAHPHLQPNYADVRYVDDATSHSDSSTSLLHTTAPLLLLEVYQSCSGSTAGGTRRAAPRRIQTVPQMWAP